MSLDIGEALKQGFNRTLERNGLMFVAVFFLVGLLNVMLANTVLMEFIPQMMGPGMTYTPPALTLPISAGVAGVLWLGVWLASTVVGITAMRTFVSSETETIPGEYYRRNMGMAVLNLFVGGIVFGIVVGAGFLLFVIPGVFLLVSMLFWSIYVAVEDQNFIEGMKNSWDLTKGSRLRVFLLLLGVGVAAFVTSIAFNLPSAVLGSTVGNLVVQLGSGFISVFSAATLAQAYNQLNQ